MALLWVGMISFNSWAYRLESRASERLSDQPGQRAVWAWRGPSSHPGLYLQEPLVMEVDHLTECLVPRVTLRVKRTGIHAQLLVCVVALETPIASPGLACRAWRGELVGRRGEDPPQHSTRSLEPEPEPDGGSWVPLRSHL